MSKYRNLKTLPEIEIESQKMRLEKKSWISDLRGFENAWTNQGEGTFTLGGSSQFPLPSNVYKLAIDNYGNLLYIAINVVGDNLIKLPNSKADEILNTIETFWNSKEDYTRFGQVHKRGILLYGKPGTGKSSTLDLLFNQLLKRNGVVFIVDDPEICIKAVQRFRLVEPDRPLILLYEDIDHLLEKYGEPYLLAMMDGQFQFSNVLHLGTTNYIDNVPPRLRNRPSRFDEVVEIPPPTANERKLFVEHIMQPVEDKSKILKIVKDTDAFSFAHIKELIISVYLLGKNYDEVLARLRSQMETEN